MFLDFSAHDFQDLKVTKGTKIMMVGSTLDDVLAVSATPNAQELKETSGATASAKKEPLSKQKPHSKVTEKGPPEDAIPGVLNVKESLPPQPLSGMLNKSGGKVRLTFKLGESVNVRKLLVAFIVLKVFSLFPSS